MGLNGFNNRLRRSNYRFKFNNRSRFGLYGFDNWLRSGDYRRGFDGCYWFENRLRHDSDRFGLPLFRFGFHNWLRL